MSAGLRNESASAKRGARSGAGQRSTSSLSHARPGCAGADKRKLRNVESRDGLDKDLEMPKEPNGVLISSAGQPSERGDGDPHSTVRRPRVDRPKINGETAGGARHAAVGTRTRDREGHRKDGWACRRQRLGRGAFSQGVWDFPRRAKDRDNVEPVLENPIDDSVRRSNQLAKILPGPFGNDSARKWKLLQNVDSSHYSLNDEHCVPRRVPCDEVTDGSEILCGLGRPTNRDYPRNRFLMSSCAIVSPAADCSRPRSTLARKYKRSIASSTVALSGRCSTVSTIFCFSPVDAMSS